MNNLVIRKNTRGGGFVYLHPSCVASRLKNGGLALQRLMSGARVELENGVELVAVDPTSLQNWPCPLCGKGIHEEV